MRHALLTRFNHPRVGQNLLMTGSDRLGGGISTSPVSQTQESGEGILGDKSGRGMLLWYDVVVAVLSSPLILGRTPRQYVMTHHNGNFLETRCLLRWVVTVTEMCPWCLDTYTHSLSSHPYV